jgi:hypothetical protein
MTDLFPFDDLATLIDKCITYARRQNQISEPAVKYACFATSILTQPTLSTPKIIHCDCDCFYAAVEMRDAPSL